MAESMAGVADRPSTYSEDYGGGEDTPDSLYESGRYGLNVDALLKSISSSYRSLDGLRKLYRANVREFAGPSFAAASEDSTAPEKFLNKLKQAAIATTVLVGTTDPQASISPKRDKSLQPFASLWETTFNDHVQEIEIKKTVHRWLLDSFLGGGFVRTYMASSPQVVLEMDLQADPGIPYASNILLDDMVWHASASDWRSVQYVGNMYRLPYEDYLKGCKAGIFKFHRDVKPTTKRMSGGDESERTDRVGRGEDCDADEFRPMVDFADVWLRSEGTIVTLPVADRSCFKCLPIVLAEEEWGEPDGCPYHRIEFEEVPGSVQPAALANDLRPLDVAVNRQLRKSIRQADRQKNVCFYSTSGGETARSLKGAIDGELIAGDPATVKPISYGGVDAMGMSHLETLIALFDTASGNLTAMLGLGAQTDTVGQEQLIHGASNRYIQRMQERVVDAIKKLFRSLGYLMSEDEVNTYTGYQAVPGFEQEFGVYRELTPEIRQGMKFTDYKFEMNLWGIVNRSPEQLMTEVNQLMGQIYIPSLQFMLSQGGYVDFSELAAFHAKHLRYPGFTNIVRFNNVAADQEGPKPAGDGPSKPATGERHYVRHNVSSGRENPANGRWAQIASAQRAERAQNGG